MDPRQVEHELWHTRGLDGFGKQRLLMDWHHAQWRHEDGPEARAAFLDGAHALLGLAKFIHGDGVTPVNSIEERMRDEWLALEATRLRRTEQRRQRRLLREGAETLRHIRAVLRGQAPLPHRESAPGRSSQA